jgi:uncharacterized membrane protein YbhN (UPF0104 family)
VGAAVTGGGPAQDRDPVGIARSAESFQLFASAPPEPLARRPVDGLRAVACVLLLVVAGLLAKIGSDLDKAASEVLTAFPGFLTVFWLSGFWLAVGWSAVLVVIGAFRRRPLLAAACVGAAAGAVGLSVAAAAVVSGEAGDVISRVVDVDGPPVFAPAALAITSAVIAVMAPYLTRPWRRFGRALILAQMVGALFLAVARPLGIVASLAIGLLAGTTMHLLRGSPGGFPTVTRVKAALADLGVDVEHLAPIGLRREGVAVLVGADRDGAIDVRVYGRDAWEGELLSDLWRLAWYRGRRRTARVSRGEYVEHEGFMTMLAARGGVRVPEVVTAGLADNGDALIVMRPDGRPLLESDGALTAEQVRCLWGELGRLHAGGIVHHRIDLDRIASRADSSAGFNDLSSASVQSRKVDAITDRAQLLALTIVTSGKDLAVEEATSALGHDGLVAVLPYLQEPATPPLVRAALRRGRVDMDAIRADLATAIDASEVELVNVRRVTWRSLLDLALLAVAAYTIIGMIAGIDLDAFGRSLADANWWWLFAALLIAQTPRFASALSTLGSTAQPLPFGPTTALQFATCYVNIAVPSSAARVAISARFFQRFGVEPAAAVSASMIDSVSEFVVQIILFVSVFFISDIDLGLTLNEDQLSGIATTALILVAAVVGGGGIAFAIAPVRKRVGLWFHQARDALRVLRNPRKLLALYGGNLLTQVLFAVTLGACVRAFGFDVPLSSLILINTVVSLFAGFIPVPGGVGVTEAGLSLGLTRAGVPSDSAFAIALAYRFTTFYLPPIWGLRCFRWLTAHRYL